MTEESRVVDGPPALRDDDGSSDRAPAPDDRIRLAVLEHLPVAIILIDHIGNIRYANTAITEMTGLPLEELVGANLLDFVAVDDLEFAIDLLERGADFDHRVMGPSRVRYRDTADRTQWTEVWARVAPVDLGFDGYIVSLTSESVHDVLASAVGNVSQHGPLDRTLFAAATSARAQPLCGTGVVLVVEGTSGPTPFRLVGDWPLAIADLTAPESPWMRTLASGSASDIVGVAEAAEADGCEAALLGRLVERGFTGAYVRPVIGEHGVVAVYVVFHHESTPASSNQDRHLAEVTQLVSMAIAQERQRALLEERAVRDALSGALNRSALDERLLNDRRSADVLFIDLDRFKVVNDTFGHEVGDRVLAEVGHRLHDALRGGDDLYRAGGDEFVVVTESSADEASQRIALAERIVEAMAAPFDVDDHRVRIGATVGIASGGGRSLAETIRAADAAMYLAKERGRSRWAHAH